VNPITVIGTGGHCRSVLSTINLLEDWKVEMLIDWDFKGNKEIIMGHRVDGGPELLEDLPSGNVFISVGNNKLRKDIIATIREREYSFPNIINPYAFVDPTAVINSGNLIGYGAFIGPMVTIGSHNIINTSAILEHETSVGDYCHIAPSSTVCGRAIIENNVLLGAGSVVLPNTRIRNDCTIGLGAVVIKDTELENRTYVGSPANIIE